MSDVEVHFGDQRVGEIFRRVHRGRERISFRYVDTWLRYDGSFAIDPELPLDRSTSVPSRGEVFAAFSDAAPDRWGRRLMQRQERRSADKERRALRALSELDYVLGVSDRSRLGALRFRVGGTFVSPADDVPTLLRLQDLLDATRRIVRGDETDEDLALIFVPGSSLGGARPKASVLDTDGALCIAKFPRDGDDYPIERWEMVALQLARSSQIRTAEARLETVNDKPVLISRRFDRSGEERIHFASAMTLLGLADGDDASYPEIAELLQRYGSRPKQDLAELYRRMVFNICVANVDDHLRNHGFLRERGGYRLSPAYDLNPVPMDVRPRILSTAVTPDDATGSIDAALESAPYFDLKRAAAEAVVREVKTAVASWRSVAKRLGALRKECDRLASAFLD